MCISLLESVLILIIIKSKVSSWITRSKFEWLSQQLRHQKSFFCESFSFPRWRPWSDLFLSVDALNGWLDSKEGREKWWRIVEDEEKAEKRKIKKKKQFLITSYDINYVLPLNFNWYYSMPHKVIIVFGYCDQKHEVWKLQSKGNPRYLK